MVTRISRPIITAPVGQPAATASEMCCSANSGPATSAAFAALPKRSCSRAWAKPLHATSSHQLFGTKVRTSCSSRPETSADPSGASVGRARHEHGQRGRDQRHREDGQRVPPQRHPDGERAAPELPDGRGPVDDAGDDDGREQHPHERAAEDEHLPVRQLHARRPQHDDGGERERLADGEEPEEEGGEGTAADEGDDPGGAHLDCHGHAGDARNAARRAGPGEHHGRGRRTARLVEADRPLRCGRATIASPVDHRRVRQL